MIEFLRKIKFEQVATTLILLFYVYFGIYLAINEPFDLLGAFFYILFLSVVVLAWFSASIEVKSSRPTKFFIIEVERWIVDDYQKVYFIEQEYKSSFYIYNTLYKELIEQTKEKYEENDNFVLSENQAMTNIIETVKSYLIIDKKEPGVIVKSINPLKEITFDEVVALIKKSNAD